MQHIKRVQMGNLVIVFGLFTTYGILLAAYLSHRITQYTNGIIYTIIAV